MMKTNTAKEGRMNALINLLAESSNRQKLLNTEEQEDVCT